MGDWKKPFGPSMRSYLFIYPHRFASSIGLLHTFRQIGLPFIKHSSSLQLVIFSAQ
ncbi:Uncharacterized protein DAT39_006433 [Clarias magur]|uniref:Uncharacterized protein n=1 Tax=Clarias magur TaxID=1594786 RepID=A0A8J4UUA7_CLAMG|nr:Uncharacterized protein DAT39_006433 [Clarias magur]